MTSWITQNPITKTVVLNKGWQTLHHTHTRDGPPMVDLMRYTLVGSIRVHRVLIEDLSIGLYQWVNCGKIFYLQTLNPFLDTLEGVKTIYIYLEKANSLVPEVCVQRQVQHGIQAGDTSKGLHLYVLWNPFVQNHA